MTTKTMPIDGQISLFAQLEVQPEGMTQEEVDRCLLTGSGREGGKRRIAEFFARECDAGARASFLKAEYGDGGKFPCCALEDRSKEISIDYGSRGICLRYCRGKPYTKLLSWPMVARIIGRLIDSGAYAADDEEEDGEEADR